MAVAAAPTSADGHPAASAGTCLFADYGGSADIRQRSPSGRDLVRARLITGVALWLAARYFVADAARVSTDASAPR
jgi:hypothetical protein